MNADAFGASAGGQIQLRPATQAWELSGAAALRREVFCAEQAIFEGDDRDDLDAIAHHLVALSIKADHSAEVVGTVRIHEAEPHIWYGSRLAVASRYRRSGALGTALIRLAVSSATSRGCLRFLAHVQAPNELMFRRLNWHSITAVELHGRPHVLMQADLTAYRPLAETPDACYAHAELAAACR